MMEARLKDRIHYHFDNVYNQSPQKYQEFMLYQFGELNCEGELDGWTYKQWCYEITYMISGEMQGFVDGQKYLMHEGDILISPLNRVHRLYVAPDSSARFAYLAFRLNEFALKGEYRNLSEFYSPDMTSVFTHDKAGVSYAMFRALDEYYHRYPGYRPMFEAYVRQILFLIRRCFAEEGFSPRCSADTQNFVGAPIYAAIRFIEENLNTISRVRDVAEALGYANNYISTLFREKMGVTLQQFILATVPPDRGCLPWPGRPLRLRALRRCWPGVSYCCRRRRNRRSDIPPALCRSAWMPQAEGQQAFSCLSYESSLEIYEKLYSSCTQLLNQASMSAP